MKLMCRKCTIITKHTIWKIVRCEYFGSKKLICNHCDCDISIYNTTATKIVRAMICGLIVVTTLFLFFDYMGEASSILVSLVLMLLFASALYCAFMPLYAFLLCFANNCEYRIRKKLSAKP